MASQNHRPLRSRRRGPLRTIRGHFQRTFGAGILAFLPIGITVLVLKFFFDLLDPLLEPAVDRLPGPGYTGFGLVALVILIYLAGLVAAFVVGRRLIGITHRVMEFIPVVKSIYGTTRAAVEMMSTTDDSRYSGVVLIDFPRIGTKSIGLVTSRMVDLNGEETLAIYIPTTPIPSSGFLVLARSTEVTPTDLSVEEAMKMVISGGILSQGLGQRLGVVPRDRSSSNQ